jgi:hypothetical protein
MIVIQILQDDELKPTVAVKQQDSLKKKVNSIKFKLPG